MNTPQDALRFWGVIAGKSAVSGENSNVTLRNISIRYKRNI